MSIKNYLINSPTEINNLKSDLMSNNSSSNNSMKTLSSAFNQFYNMDIGPIFKDNIRKTLTNIYGWKETNYPRNFYYRVIEYEGKSDIFIENYAKKLHIANAKIIIEDNFVTVINPDGKQEQIALKNDEINKFVIGGKKLAIGFRQKIEVDGIFSEKSADISKFNKEEIELVYNNVDFKNLKKYEYIIVEIKLSQKRINDLTDQLIRDKFVFELITKKENLFLGFTKGKDIKFQLEDKIEGINFILLGLKNSYLGERKMDQFLDWKTIQDLDNLKKDLNNRFETFDNKFLNVLNELKDIKSMIAEQKGRKKSSSSSDSKYQNNEEVNDKKMEKKKERAKSEKISSIPSKTHFLSFKRHPIPYMRYLLKQNIKMKNSKKE